MKKAENVEKGKKNRKKGGEFELAVRKDLMAKGWIVTKFDNDVEFPEENINLPPSKRIGELKQAKKSFNPFTKRVGYGNGFPDFVCLRVSEEKSSSAGSLCWTVLFVEAKSNGYLKPIEREKIAWLKKNKNAEIIVAKKGIKKEIIYETL